MTSTTPILTSPSPPRPANDSFRGFGNDGPTFFDVLDIVNPLQHIPIISTIYRAISGDTIDAIPRIIGGAIFGGLIGAVSSLINVIVDELTGSDIGEHVLSFVDDIFGGFDVPTTAHIHPDIPQYPMDKNEEVFPTKSAATTAMRDATRQYDVIAEMTATRSGGHIDLYS